VFATTAGVGSYRGTSIGTHVFVCVATDPFSTMRNIHWTVSCYKAHEAAAATLSFAQPSTFPAGTWEFGVPTMYLDGIYQQALALLSYGIARSGKEQKVRRAALLRARPQHLSLTVGLPLAHMLAPRTRRTRRTRRWTRWLRCRRRCC
jgi:hypothetical protein